MTWNVVVPVILERTSSRGACAVGGSVTARVPRSAVNVRVASLSGVVTVGAVASTATSRVDSSDAVRADVGLVRSAASLACSK